MINEEEIRDIYRRKKQKILKWGTYVIDNPDRDEATRAAYEAIMPTRMEDSIQNSINAIMQEQNSNKEEEPSELAEDELVAEILKKYQNNIQNNVNELFK